VLRTDETGTVLPLEGGWRRVYSVQGRYGAWAPDGRLFVTGSQDRVWVWPARE
jgi:hypothetical protein